MGERTSRGAYGEGLAQLGALGATRLLQPQYLSSADLPWIQRLLAERARFAGQPKGAFRTHVGECLGPQVPVAKMRLALRVLDRYCSAAVPKAPPPSLVRREVFRSAAIHADRTQALAAAAARLGVDGAELMSMLFADLPDERRLGAWAGEVDGMQLVMLCNEALVFDLLQRALRVRIRAHGHVRAVVRQAHLTGLLCVVREGSTHRAAELEVSGPFALFRHSRLYGRALASLVPRLARCRWFSLEADCVLDGGRELGRLVIRSGDPIQPARELREFDSRVEERFARDFARLALEWDVIREPRPLAAGRGLFFPDFELRRRTTGDRYWVEIVGFWTAEYLAKKLEQLACAGLDHMILCVDESRQCAPGQLEALGRVVRYKQRVDVRRVIAIVDPGLASRVAHHPHARRPSVRARAAPASSDER